MIFKLGLYNWKEGGEGGVGGGLVVEFEGGGLVVVFEEFCFLGR